MNLPLLNNITYGQCCMPHVLPIHENKICLTNSLNCLPIVSIPGQVMAEIGGTGLGQNQQYVGNTMKKTEQHIHTLLPVENYMGTQ